MSDFIIEANLENFQSIVDKSMQTPVLIDFWAPWCGPCKTLVPILHKIAEDFNGSLILAKVNTEENQELAAHFQIRSIPTVMLVKDGAVVDQFNGALPESGVLEFLQKNGVVNQLGQILQEVAELNAKADFEQVANILSTVIANYPDNYDIKLNLARALIRLQRNDDAKVILDSLSDADKNKAEIKALLSSLQFADSLPADANIDELKAKGDIQSNYELGLIYLAQNDYEQALEYLMQVLYDDKNYQEGKAHKSFLDALAILGNSNPLALQYRRKLFTLLH